MTYNITHIQLTDTHQHLPTLTGGHWHLPVVTYTHNIRHDTSALASDPDPNSWVFMYQKATPRSVFEDLTLAVDEPEGRDKRGESGQAWSFGDENPCGFMVDKCLCYGCMIADGTN